MNLNRLKSNLVNRDWNSKNTKTNISYIKGKLRQFGLSTPKYLDNGKLSNKQIQTQTKRIINAINREKDILRNEANKSTLEKAMKKLEKVVDKHNQLVYKKLNYVVTKHNLSENQLNFLLGRDVWTDSYKMKDKIVIKRQNSQFQVINLENYYADSIETVNLRIKQINKFNERLSNKNINEEIANDLVSLNAIENLLNGYVNDGIMEEHVKSQIMAQLKGMNGMQQKVFYNILMNTTPKEKYNTTDDDFEDLQLNLYNKWSILLGQARKF